MTTATPIGHPKPIDPTPLANEFDLTIEAGRTEKHYWLDLWRYRELFLVLAQRDISVRYKQTFIGAAWAVIQPVLNMLIMTVIFGRIAGLHSDGGTPYPVMVFAGMLPWMFFSSALASASQSMVTNSNLIAKVYFPRLIIPVSSVGTCLVDFAVSFLLMIGLLLWYRISPCRNLLALPILIALISLAAFGPGLLIAALNVKYRDFRYIIPFLIQFGLYATPVGFSSSVVREKFGEMAFLAYSLNPMVGTIDGFRWALLGSRSPLDPLGLLISLSTATLFFFVGVWHFRKTEKSFADII